MSDEFRMTDQQRKDWEEFYLNLMEQATRTRLIEIDWAMGNGMWEHALHHVAYPDPNEDGTSNPPTYTYIRSRYTRNGKPTSLWEYHER